MQSQWGLLFREQLLRVGVTPAAIDKRLARGPIDRGPAVRVPDAWWRAGSRQAVLAAAVRAGGYATGWSALGLRGVLDLDGLRPWIAVPEQARVRGADFIVQREPLADGGRR